MKENHHFALPGGSFIFAFGWNEVRALGFKLMVNIGWSTSLLNILSNSFLNDRCLIKGDICTRGPSNIGVSKRFSITTIDVAVKSFDYLVIVTISLWPKMTTIRVNFIFNHVCAKGGVDPFLWFLVWCYQNWVFPTRRDVYRSVLEASYWRNALICVKFCKKLLCKIYLHLLKSHSFGSSFDSDGLWQLRSYRNSHSNYNTFDYVRHYRMGEVSHCRPCGHSSCCDQVQVSIKWW